MIVRTKKDLERENKGLRRYLSKNIKENREHLIKVETSWGNIVRLDKMILKGEVEQTLISTFMITSLSLIWSFNDFFIGRNILGVLWLFLGFAWGYMFYRKYKFYRKIK